MRPLVRARFRRIDEWFTRLVFAVATLMGTWWMAALSVAAVLIWLAFGPLSGWSDSWQLWMNSSTQIFGLWAEALLAAAANRNERHLRQQYEHEREELRAEIRSAVREALQEALREMPLETTSKQRKDVTETWHSW